MSNLSQYLKSILLVLLMLGTITILPISSTSSNNNHTRYVYVRNFEDREFIDFPVYLVLAFPDNNVTESQLNSMTITDGLNNQIPYQIEDNSTYVSGYIKWAGVWLLISSKPNETKEYTISFTDSPLSYFTNLPFSYGTFGTISTNGGFINITTNSLALVSIKYDHGLAWVSLQDKDGNELLGEPDSPNKYNTVFAIESQQRGGSYSHQIRYGDGITDTCTISYENGALFAKVFWDVVDDFGNDQSGWFRVWKHQPWIEFWTNGTAPVNSTYSQAWFCHKIISTNTKGSEVNNGTINYIINNASTLALTSVIYYNPTNFYGEVKSGCGTKIRAKSYAKGVLEWQFKERLANFTNFDSSAINGKLGVPTSFLLKTNSNIETAICDYFKRPIASYYCAQEDLWAKNEIIRIAQTFLETYPEKFIGQLKELEWHRQTAKARATFITLGVDYQQTINGVTHSQLDWFIKELQNFTPNADKWLASPSHWGQTIPNIITASYWVHRTITDVDKKILIEIEIERILNTMANFHTNVENIDDMFEPVNKRKACLEMMYQIREMLGECDNITLLLDAMGNNYLYNSTEAFNYFYFPKYGLRGQSYGVWSKRQMHSLVTANYIVDVSQLSGDDRYTTLDIDTWTRSYGVLQDSVWTRTRGLERDDYMWEWAHDPQDRINHLSSHMAYIRIFLLPRDGIKGTSTARLSLEYVKINTNATGFIPFASDYVLAFMNQTWDNGRKIRDLNLPIAPGWYSDVGLFEIGVMNVYDNPSSDSTHSSVFPWEFLLVAICIITMLAITVYAKRSQNSRDETDLKVIKCGY